MKNILFALSMVAVLSLSSCATKTETWTPVGTWDYTVKDTPSGDGYGTLIITQEKKEYGGTLRSPEYGDAALTDFQLDGNKFKADLYLAGMDMTIEGTFDDDALLGKVVATGYGEFPLEAIRQSEQ